MASRELRQLHDDFRPRVDGFLEAVKAAEIKLLVYCTKRTPVEQARLWRQGRSGRVIGDTCRFLIERSAAFHDGSARMGGVETLQGQTAVALIPTVKDARDYSAWQGNLIESVGPQYQLRVVTNAKPGDSAHNYGFAFDCVPIVDGDLAWASDRLWDRLGELAIAHDIEWSGTWRNMVERTHFQHPDWRAAAIGTEDDLDGVL